MKKNLVLIIYFLFISFLYSETIIFNADSMTGTAGSKSDYTKLEGNASVKTSSMVIYADIIELKGKDFRYITASGNISGTNSQSKLDFTCGKLSYDRETKLIKLEDSVCLNDIENEVTAEAQLIEYNQNTELAVMQISVNLKQKNNICTSAYAIYRKNEQMLEMNGNPKVIQGDDSFRAQTISLNLSTQEILLDGRVSGSVTTNTQSEQKENISQNDTNSTSQNYPTENNEQENNTTVTKSIINTELPINTNN